MIITIAVYLFGFIVQFIIASILNSKLQQQKLSLSESEFVKTGFENFKKGFKSKEFELHLLALSSIIWPIVLIIYLVYNFGLFVYDVLNFMIETFLKFFTYISGLWNKKL